MSFIFTPCKRYTSCTSFTKYCCTAEGPLIRKISSGVIEPSDRGFPARTKSFSCTKIWLESFTKYLRSSPKREVTITSLLPRFILPNDTTPSISETIAGLEGLRASNNSVTRGRPPVISPALAELRGIFTNTLPSSILLLLSTIMWAPTGKL